MNYVPGYREALHNLSFILTLCTCTHDCEHGTDGNGRAESNSKLNANWGEMQLIAESGRMGK